MINRIEDLVFTEMKRNLDARFEYHSIEHTRMVMEAAETLGTEEEIRGEELKLLRLAALFHDTGFLHTYDEHEEFSCDYASKILAGHGFSTNKIDQICHMIRGTNIRIRPGSHLQAILRDADLLYLGTSNFPEFSLRLQRELISFGKLAPTDDWISIEINFLQKQKFLTLSGRRRTEAGVVENLQILSRERRLAG